MNYVDSTTKNMTSREHDVAGCEQTFTSDYINSLQSESLYESRYCPFRTLSCVDCPWTGILSDIGGHVRSEHGSETTSGFPVKFTVALQNISTAEHYRKAVFISDKLFYLIWVLKNATLYFTVFHFEPQNESSGFTYRFRITGYKKEVSVLDTCLSYWQHQREALKLEGYLALHYSMVEKYLDQSKGLSCHIHILGTHATKNPSHDMTDECEAVASEFSHLSAISSPHFPLSASSNQSPHSSTKSFSVISFLFSYLLCGFFVLFLFFVFIHFATYCTCIWNFLTFQQNV
jgi:hypothetical protein